MVDHFVSIDLECFSLNDRLQLICKAPADSHCHAVYDCDCEQWFKSGTDGGKPWHIPGDYSEPEYERHFGRFDPSECCYVDWAENCDEVLRGTVVIPVRAQWEGDYYTFHAEGADAAETDALPAGGER